MLYKIAVLTLLVLLVGTQADELKDSTAPISVQATNYTHVPSVLYIVDAVECLQEAYSIYEDDENRASLYAALYQERHNETWNVVVGYSAVYVSSEMYVETVVTDNKEKDSKEEEKRFLIFSID